jgi:hypothetical protein
MYWPPCIVWVPAQTTAATERDTKAIEVGPSLTRGGSGQHWEVDAVDASHETVRVRARHQEVSEQYGADRRGGKRPAASEEEATWY